MDTEKRHPVGDAVEQAVRCYLVMVHDPSWLVAVPEYERLRRERDQAADPLERIKLDAQLRGLQRVLAERCEAGFVACAKQWADAHGVTAEAFRAEGVPDAVLHRAGFVLHGDRRPTRRDRGGHASRSASEIRAALPTGRFTVDDVELRSGASRGAVRRVIRLMLRRGELEEVPSAEGRRGARVYRRVR